MTDDYERQRQDRDLLRQAEIQRQRGEDFRHRFKLVSLCVAAFVVVLVLVVVIWVGFRTVGRSQSRADAKNRVKISTIEIQNQEQRVEIAKQQAEIRLQDAIGVREAQDEIAKTLTPLYVQFEMVTALQAIATSGRNNSVVYIPAGANGIPLVDNVGVGQVGQPPATGK